MVEGERIDAAFDAMIDEFLEADQSYRLGLIQIRQPLADVDLTVSEMLTAYRQQGLAVFFAEEDFGEASDFIALDTTVKLFVKGIQRKTDRSVIMVGYRNARKEYIWMVVPASEEEWWHQEGTAADHEQASRISKRLFGKDLTQRPAR